MTEPRLLSGGNPSLDPEPPKASKHPEVRYLDIHEDDEVDEDLIASWIEQASALPGEHV